MNRTNTMLKQLLVGRYSACRQISHLEIAFCIALNFTLGGDGVGAIAASPKQTSTYHSFAYWCLNQANLSPDARYTIFLLLQNAGTTECNQATHILSSLTKLSLNNHQISDISPLSSLTNLTELSLSDNKISDINPLKSLTNLTNLYLSNNQISDIRPLSSLTKLTSLGLYDNKISDISPLKSLTNLIELGLSDNKIAEISSLKSLTTLTNLTLQRNPINNKSCPLEPEDICKF